jgi:hypothetical protein
MFKEKSKELFRALNVILDAITGLNLRDLGAEAKADRGSLHPRLHVTVGREYGCSSARRVRKPRLAFQRT